MGRRKNFSRESVLEKAIPVFWTRGYADTSLQALELATGVNKSGLYAEFQDKDDLFLASLKHYLDARRERGLLTAEPLGWSNVERFLKNGYTCRDGQRGCFSVNSMRELAVLPQAARELVDDSMADLKAQLIRNIDAAGGRKPAAAADLVLIFFLGICMDQNLEGSKAATTRKIDHFMQMMQASE